MSQYRVLVVTSLHPTAMERLDSRDDLDIRLIESMEEDDIVDNIGDVDAVTVRTAKITRRVIEAASDRLKVIARHGVGYDNVDLAAASERGVPVTITIDANAASVAEQTLAYFLAQAKQMGVFDEQTKAGNWVHARGSVKTVDLGGCTLLIMGVGRIGSRVATLANAFGMRVLGYDPAYSAKELAQRGVEAVSDWRAALPDADFLTLHCPRQDDTLNLVDRSVLSAMKPGAFLVNCARGGLVNEADLRDALVSGQLGGAALDVFDVEPAGADHPLFSAPNLIVSPHSSASSREGMMRMGDATVQAVFDAIDNKIPLDTVVNSDVMG